MGSPPQRIDRYQIVSLIGPGRRSILYRAWDPKLGRHLAIKLLQVDDDELRSRLAREAQLVARLRHPNIVMVHDVGDHEGQPFIAMEFVAGRALSDIIRLRIGLPITRKLELMSQLCDGLGFAHNSGLVHRNIKPANVMIEDAGVVKILDFGLARLSESTATPAGRIVGTLNYMSPEQLTGQTVDRRSDIFAVGALLYEFLSARQAFPGGLDTGILYKILDDRPEPLSVSCPDLDDGVVRIVDRCLEKDPRARYQDLASLRTDLEDARVRLESVTLAATEVIDPASPKGGEYRRALEDALRGQARTGPREAEPPSKPDRIAAGVRAARARIDARQFKSALEELRALADSEGASPEISSLVIEAEEGQAAEDRAAQRTERAAAETAQASELFGQGDLVGALARVIAALAIEPGHGPARALREKIQQAVRAEPTRQAWAMAQRDRWEAMADTFRVDEQTGQTIPSVVPQPGVRGNAFTRLIDRIKTAAQALIRRKPSNR